mmetsp:Transcript_50476/g.114626  ORF Transcript_50476/g.114626 Transcript_50476/m.114626 type:complete len:256 (-) Transcript_50476:1417-2184(-)
MVRGSGSPRSISSHQSLSESGCGQALTMVPTRMSICTASAARPSKMGPPAAASPPFAPPPLLVASFSPLGAFSRPARKSSRMRLSSLGLAPRSSSPAEVSTSRANSFFFFFLPPLPLPLPAPWTGCSGQLPLASVQERSSSIRSERGTTAPVTRPFIVDASDTSEACRPTSGPDMVPVTARRTGWKSRLPLRPSSLPRPLTKPFHCSSLKAAGSSCVPGREPASYAATKAEVNSLKSPSLRISSAAPDSTVARKG